MPEEIRIAKKAIALAQQLEDTLDQLHRLVKRDPEVRDAVGRWQLRLVQLAEELPEYMQLLAERDAEEYMEWLAEREAQKNEAPAV